MKHLFIINPAAGKFDHTADFSDKINFFCSQNGLSFEIACSKQPGNCTAIVKKAAQTGEALRVYACGGDGTLNEVVCGAAAFENVAVTHFPCGSGNDFIKIFDQPEAFRDLNRFCDTDEVALDLIEVGDSYSLNICSMGFDARIANKAGKYKRLPLVSGHGAYNISVITNLIRGIHHHYVVEVDGETLDSRFTMICVCNGRWYGGGYQPVPEAMPDDRKLEVLLVSPVSRLQVAGLVGKYKDGKYSNYPHLFRHITTDRIVIHCDKEEVINLDGEARYGKNVEMKLSEKKLRFFFPKGLSFR